MFSEPPFFGPPPRDHFMSVEYGCIKFKDEDELCQECKQDLRQDQLAEVNVCGHWASGKPCDFNTIFSEVEQRTLCRGLLRVTGCPQLHPRYINSFDMLPLTQCAHWASKCRCCPLDCQKVHARLCDMRKCLREYGSNDCHVWLAKSDDHGMSTHLLFSRSGEVRAVCSSTPASEVPGHAAAIALVTRIVREPPNRWGQTELIHRLMMDLLLNFSNGSNHDQRLQNYVTFLRRWIDQNNAILLPISEADRS